MLEFTVIMDSPVQEIFAVKCCSFKLLDQNFEVLVKNHGDSPLRVRSVMDLEGDDGTTHIPNLIPQGDPVVLPGESVALYCYVDEVVYQASNTLAMYDTKDHIYRTQLPPLPIPE